MMREKTAFKNKITDVTMSGIRMYIVQRRGMSSQIDENNKLGENYDQGDGDKI